MTDITSQETKNKQLAMVIYALYGAGVFTGGFTFIVGIIINVIKANDVAGTWLASHFRYQQRTALFGFLWMVIGAITAIVGVGIAVMIATGIWMIYRIIKGWLYLNDNKPMYADKKPTAAAITGN